MTDWSLMGIFSEFCSYMCYFFNNWAIDVGNYIFFVCPRLQFIVSTLTDRKLDWDFFGFYKIVLETETTIVMWYNSGNFAHFISRLMKLPMDDGTVIFCFISYFFFSPQSNRILTDNVYVVIARESHGPDGAGIWVLSDGWKWREGTKGGQGDYGKK